MKNSRRTVWILVGIVITVVLFLWANGAYAYNPTQQQGQAQAQAQGQISINKNDNSANNSNSNANVQSVTINEAPQPRTYHPAADVRFAPLGSYNGEYIRGANFIPIRTLIAIKKIFSYKAAYKDYGKQYGKGKCLTIGHSYNGREEIEPSKEIKVYTEIDLTTVITIGFLTVKSIEKNIDSFMVLQKAVLSASLMKADAILITGEGAETTVKTSGWGIGFNTSSGIINDMGNRGRSAAGSGGTGWSTGEANLLTFPWLQIQVLKYK